VSANRTDWRVNNNDNFSNKKNGKIRGFSPADASFRDILEHLHRLRRSSVAQISPRSRKRSGEVEKCLKSRRASGQHQSVRSKRKRKLMNQAAKRQQELKDPQLRDDLVAARAVLKKNTRSCC
jgi:hypothetical protein